VGYAAKALWFLPSFAGISGRVTADDFVAEGDFLMVNISNCRRYAAGEFNLNRNGVLDDGQFEVWIFRGKRWPMLLRHSLAIGLESQDLDPNISFAKTSSVRIETEIPAAYHLDAEPVGETPLACKIQPGALRVLVPRGAPEGLFSRPGRRLASDD
jgi:diacylglycerol kinase family enzyme